MGKINFTAGPTLYTRPGVTARGASSISALKNTHVSFNGYGIKEGDSVTFTSFEEYTAKAGDLIKIMPTYAGSANSTCVVLVWDENKKQTRWLNMSLFGRSYVNKTTSEREFPDKVRETTGPMAEDYERLQYLAGKTISCVGTDTTSYTSPVFDRDTHQVKRDENGKICYTQEVVKVPLLQVAETNTK